jgi:hypothetical protein
MTVRHTLPSGGWIEIREASELRAKDRKAVMRQMKDPETGRVMSSMTDMADLIAAAVIVAWDIPSMPGAPIPSQQLDVLDELTLVEENEIQDATKGLTRLFMPKPPTPDDYVKPDGTPNVDSPTEPASA